jgi:hypothetical protein
MTGLPDMDGDTLEGQIKSNTKPAGSTLDINYVTFTENLSGTPVTRIVALFDLYYKSPPDPYLNPTDCKAYFGQEVTRASTGSTPVAPDSVVAPDTSNLGKYRHVVRVHGGPKYHTALRTSQ